MVPALPSENRVPPLSGHFPCFTSHPTPLTSNSAPASCLNYAIRQMAHPQPTEPYQAVQDAAKPRVGPKPTHTEPTVRGLGKGTLHDQPGAPTHWREAACWSVSPQGPQRRSVSSPAFPAPQLWHLWRQAGAGCSPCGLAQHWPLAVAPGRVARCQSPGTARSMMAL